MFLRSCERCYILAAFSTFLCSWAIFTGLTHLPGTDGGKQEPRPDQIARKINETYSILWDCTHSDCPVGFGLSVKCGTSVPYSTRIICKPCKLRKTYSDSHGYETCKKCNTCKLNQVIAAGNCTPERDTIKCKCKDGFYEDEHGKCRFCGFCCGDGKDRYILEGCAHMPPNQRCANRTEDCPTSATPPPVRSQPTALSTHGMFSSGDVAGIAVGATIGGMLLAALFSLCYCNRAWIEQKLRRSASQHSRDTSQWNNEGEAAVPLIIEPPQGHQSSNNATPGILVEGITKPNETGMPRHRLRSQMSHQPARSPSEPTSAKFRRIHSHPGAFRLGSKSQEYTLLEGEEPEDIPGQEPESGIALDHEIPAVAFLGGNPGVSTDQQTSTTDLPFVTCTSQERLDKERQKVMEERASQIPFHWSHKICALLNINRGVNGGDYRDLGEKIGLEIWEIQALGNSPNPTDELLQKLGATKGGTVSKFVEYLEQIGRFDVIAVIDEWISHNGQSNCPTYSRVV